MRFIRGNVRSNMRWNPVLKLQRSEQKSLFVLCVYRRGKSKQLCEGCSVFRGAHDLWCGKTSNRTLLLRKESYWLRTTRASVVHAYQIAWPFLSFGGRNFFLLISFSWHVKRRRWTVCTIGHEKKQRGGGYLHATFYVYLLCFVQQNLQPSLKWLWLIQEIVKLFWPGLKLP